MYFKLRKFIYDKLKLIILIGCLTFGLIQLTSFHRHSNYRRINVDPRHLPRELHMGLSKVGASSQHETAHHAVAIETEAYHDNADTKEDTSDDSVNTGDFDTDADGEFEAHGELEGYNAVDDLSRKSDTVLDNSISGNENVRSEESLIREHFGIDPRLDDASLKALMNIWNTIELQMLTETKNISNIRRIPFLPNYRNPCWISRLGAEDPYRFDRFIVTRGKLVDNLNALWTARREQGLPWRLRCLPFFYIIGTSKCATTDLYRRLLGHPDIVTEAKEWHWWSVRRPPKGGHPMSSYVDVFDGVSETIRKEYTEKDGFPFHNMITMDGSPSTIYNVTGEPWGDDGPQFTNAHHIHHFYPEAKIVLIARDPVERTTQSRLRIST
ncbi:unnamed protein product [Owenia fusiformis]|uniref:Carbohydrate sulfotransferase 15 n=1 Tax=Owenia fusiformis TaxID=6347 RepID=A0A8S4Q061_OWEFU|nr:unnamed protein product [Owenia fusiformis]